MDLNDIKWGEFSVKELFIIERGNRLTKPNRIKGNTPLVTAGFQNVGVAEYIKNENQKSYSNAITIDMFGNAFYRDYNFKCDDNIHVLTNKKLSKKNGNFICNCFKKATENIFSYGKQFRLKTLEKLKIVLPINSKGEADFDLMAHYILSRELEKKEKLQNYITKRIEEVKSFKKVKPLEEKEWEEFFIEDVFIIKPGKRLTKADMSKGNIPFIGASDSNNGITNYVSNINSSIDSNVLGVNYNGSVVENFYHPYKAMFSDDVKRLSFKNRQGNEFLYLFAKSIILKQKSKYQYAYKFNEDRMTRQKIMLPIIKKNQPDYNYMENYMKQLEYNKLIKYIEFKNK